MAARLKDKYFDDIQYELKDELGLDSIMQVPRITKVTVNMGVGDAKLNRKALDHAMEQLAQISGQQPAITRARKSEAGFKIREGMAVGCKVTLRGDRMYEFLDRLITIALPRIRDFRGVSPKAFDRQGNYALGIREQVIFPEIDYDEIDTVRGMDVVLTISGGSREGSYLLLEKLGMPFRKPQPAAAAAG